MAPFRAPPRSKCPLYIPYRSRGAERSNSSRFGFEIYIDPPYTDPPRTMSRQPQTPRHIVPTPMTAPYIPDDFRQTSTSGAASVASSGSPTESIQGPSMAATSNGGPSNAGFSVANYSTALPSIEGPSIAASSTTGSFMASASGPGSSVTTSSGLGSSMYPHIISGSGDEVSSNGAPYFTSGRPAAMYMASTSSGASFVGMPTYQGSPASQTPYKTPYGNPSLATASLQQSIPIATTSTGFYTGPYPSSIMTAVPQNMSLTVPQPVIAIPLGTPIPAGYLLDKNPTLAKEMWFMLARARLTSFKEGPISLDDAQKISALYLLHSELPPQERLEAHKHTTATIMHESEKLWYYIMHSIVAPMVTSWMDESDARWAAYKHQAEHYRHNYWSTKIIENKQTGRTSEFVFASSMDSIIAVNWVYHFGDGLQKEQQETRRLMKQFIETKLILLADLVYKWTEWKKGFSAANPHMAEEQRNQEVWEHVCLQLQNLKNNPKIRDINFPIDKWPCHNTFLFERDIDMVEAIQGCVPLVGGQIRPQRHLEEAFRKYSQYKNEETVENVKRQLEESLKKAQEAEEAYHEMKQADGKLKEVQAMMDQAFAAAQAESNRRAVYAKSIGMAATYHDKFR